MCGGNQNIQTAPVTCTNSRTIDGTTFTVVLDVTAGGSITASYTLDVPRRSDTPSACARTRDLSSPEVHEASGVIPAGARSGTTVDDAEPAAEIDTKAVFTGNGRRPGRIAAPFVTTANAASRRPPPAPPTTTATTRRRPPTTRPRPTTGPTATDAVAVSPTLGGCSTTAAPSSSGALPTNGAGTGLPVVSALLVLVGIVLITKSRGDYAVPQ